MFQNLHSLRAGPRALGTAAALALALSGIGGARADAPFKAIHAFTGADGAQPANGVVVGSDGALYGATDAVLNSGDPTISDVVYKLRPDGTGYQILHTFTGTASGANTDGIAPNRLLQVNGFLYGTTYIGGANGTGVIFKMDTEGGAFQILHTFSAVNSQSVNSDGADPATGLTLGPDGALYGTAVTAGTSGGGVLYKINPDGSGYSVIHAFPARPNAATAGNQPGTALTFGSGGLLYGTTTFGGSSDKGIAFKIATNGQSFSVLHNFDSAGGSSPTGLTAASDGNLYGTNFAGGPGASGGNAAGGTIFKLTPTGTYQVLRSFTAAANQIALPLTPLTEAPDGTLYGATNGGGTAGTGAIYQISKDGSTFQTVASLTQGTGDVASGPLVLTNEKIYGTATSDGTGSAGTVFSLALPSLSHILWTNTDNSISLWTVTPDLNYTYNNYGPFPGWKSSAVAETPDGMTHILWNHAADGQASIWDVTPAGAYIHREYGPYSGWTAQGMSAGADGRLHLLWNHSPDNQLSLWSLDNAAASFTYNNYGPYSGWKAKLIATGGDGATDIVWTSTTGQASTWKVSPADGSYIHYEYGPYSGWSPNALGADSNGRASLAWGNTNFTQSLWNADFAAGTFGQNNYGPYQDWSVVGDAPGADGLRRLLWNHAPDSQMSLWTVDSAGGFAYRNYGPFPGWTAIGVSSNK